MATFYGTAPSRYTDTYGWSVPGMYEVVQMEDDDGPFTQLRLVEATTTPTTTSTSTAQQMVNYLTSQGVDLNTVTLEQLTAAREAIGQPVTVAPSATTGTQTRPEQYTADQLRQMFAYEPVPWTSEVAPYDPGPEAVEIGGTKENPIFRDSATGIKFTADQYADLLQYRNMEKDGTNSPLNRQEFANNEFYLYGPDGKPAYVKQWEEATGKSLNSYMMNWREQTGSTGLFMAGGGSNLAQPILTSMAAAEGRALTSQEQSAIASGAQAAVEHGRKLAEEASAAAKSNMLDPLKFAGIAAGLGGMLMPGGWLESLIGGTGGIGALAPGIDLATGEILGAGGMYGLPSGVAAGGVGGGMGSLTGTGYEFASPLEFSGSVTPAAQSFPVDMSGPIASSLEGGTGSIFEGIPLEESGMFPGMEGYTPYSPTPTPPYPSDVDADIAAGVPAGGAGNYAGIPTTVPSPSFPSDVDADIAAGAVGSGANYAGVPLAPGSGLTYPSDVDADIAAGAVGPGANYAGVVPGVGSFLDQLTKYAPALADLFKGYMEYDARNEAAKTIADAYKYGIDKSDPFASQRPMWQSELAKTLQPGYWQNDPALAALNKVAASDTIRALSAKGYNMSGNEQMGVAERLQDTGMNYMLPRVTQLGNLAGAQFSPAGAGSLAAASGPAMAQANLATSGALGNLFDTAVNKLPSTLEGLFGTSKARTGTDYTTNWLKGF